MAPLYQNSVKKLRLDYEGLTNMYKVRAAAATSSPRRIGSLHTTRLHPSAEQPPCRCTLAWPVPAPPTNTLPPPFRVAVLAGPVQPGT